MQRLVIKYFDCMALTRKLEIVLTERDSETRRGLFKTILQWRAEGIRMANELLSCLYANDRLRPSGNSERYCVIHPEYAGETVSLPGCVLECLFRQVVLKYESQKENLMCGKSSLLSFRKNMPLPFVCDSVGIELDSMTGRYFVILSGIRFHIILGRDRSKNKVILDKCIQGEASICEASLVIDDSRKKTYLLLGYNCTSAREELDHNRFVLAMLGAEVPIIAKFMGNGREFEIGSKEEFQHRRVQIREALKRAQSAAQFNGGGRGRSRKLLLISRFRSKEREYVRNKLHLYSRILIDYALKYRCRYIILDKENREDAISGKSHLLLNSWNYYDLQKYISYKASLYGIKVQPNNTEIRLKDKIQIGKNPIRNIV